MCVCASYLWLYRFISSLAYINGHKKRTRSLSHSFNKKKQKQTTKIVKHYNRFIAAIRKGKTSEKVSKRTLYREKGAKQKLKSIRKTTPLLFVLFIFILNQILFVCTKSTCVGCVLNETLRKFRGIRFVSFFILSIQQQRFLFYSISRSLVVLTT